DLLFETAFLGDGHDQRQKVAGDAFLAGLEEAQRAKEEVALRGVERLPVRPIAREVDRLRVPRAELLRLLEEAHRHRVPVEALAGHGRVALPHGPTLTRHSRTRAKACR